MARPKGTKYIQTPEKMYELFCKYKDWVKKNPIKVKDWVGGMGKMVIREKERPITFEGFEVFIMNLDGIQSKGINHYFINQDGGYEDFLSICQRIKKEIRDEQVTGGMAGIYNPSITQRLNNLVERTENKHEVTEIIVKEE